MLQNMDTVQIVITGFDSFSDIEENPSKIIVTELQSRLNNTASTSIFPINLAFSFKILKVSVNNCQYFHANLINANENVSSKRFIFIHFGVDAKGKQIKLEQCAYNNMSFRIPDVEDYMPQNECILSTNALESSISSVLPLESLQIKCNEYIKEMYHKHNKIADYQNKVALSTDPGRYLCNYIYYKALSFQKANKLSQESLFVHIPPFSEICKEEQLDILQYLLHQIIESFSMYDNISK